MAWVLAVVALAVLLRATFGFGDAMVAVPLLGALIGLDASAPVMALLSVVLATALLRERPELIERWTLARLLLGAALGVPLGIHLLVGLDPVWAHRSLGLLLLGFGLGSLLRRPSEAPEPEVGDQASRGAWIDLVFGLLAGASSAAFDIAGPPLLIHAALRGWGPQRLRVNLQAVFLPLALLSAGGHAIAGLWTQAVLIYAAASLPIVALGLILAPRLRARFEAGGGRRWVYGLIAALGLLELARTVI